MSLMNNDKYNVTSGADISIYDHNNLEYDDTDLLSKLFSKDHNKSGLLNMQEIQFTLQNKNEKSRYYRK